MPSTPTTDERVTPAPSRRPRLTLLALAAGVALLHLLVWQGVQSAMAGPTTPPPTPAMQVRTLTPVLAPPVETVAEAPAPVVRPNPKPKPARATPPASPPTQTVEDAVLPAETMAEPEPVLVAAALTRDTSLELTPVATAPSDDDVPVYRTRIPPAMTINYTMRRGGISGTGDLQWRPSGSGYQAKLEGQVMGFSILTWASEGGFDAAGIAPVRFTDQRRNKAPIAANFQRKAGKITYSGNPAEFPLLEGSQDRLSWMIQIAAIAAADPKRVAPGGRVTLFVSGARGDADPWSFRVQEVEGVRTGETSVQAIKLLREPRKPKGDTRVEVWLAPSLHYLPVRARLTSEGSSLELQMQSAQPAS